MRVFTQTENSIVKRVEKLFPKPIDKSFKMVYNNYRKQSKDRKKDSDFGRSPL